MDAPPDEELWVRLEDGWTPDPGLRWFVFGNAHTHRGHFHVCSETGDLHRTVNLGDVTETSAKARIWLDGFLAAYEASIDEFLGGDEELVDAATADDWERLAEWNRRFRRDGFAPPLEPMPAPDAALSSLGPPTPWCFVGELFRVWSDGRWQVADPQPKTSTPWFWPGSECDRLDDWHDEDVVGELVACERCHRVSAH